MIKSRNSLTGIIFIVSLLLILVSACKKKEIPGPQGDPGTPGVGGNATISSSMIFAVNNSQWKEDTAGQYMKATIDISLITNEVVTKGAVKAFVQTGSSIAGPIWSELPFVQGDLITQFGFDAGHLYLNFINIEGGLPSAPSTQNYRVVVLSESN